MRRDVVVGVIFAAAFSFMLAALLFTEGRSRISLWAPPLNESAVPEAYKPQPPRLPNTTVVLGTIAHAGEFFYLRSFIGSVHYWEFGREVIVFAEGLTASELTEASLASFTRVLDSNSMEAVELRKQMNVFLVPVKAIQGRRLCAADRALRANRTVALQMSADDRCTADECFRFDQYFTYRDDPRAASHETCSFDLRYPNVTVQPLTSSRPELPFWCICIATYAKVRFGSGVMLRNTEYMSVLSYSQRG